MSTRLLAPRVTRTARRIALTLASTALLACGGGGGGGSTPPPGGGGVPQNQAPVASAGPDLSVEQGATVDLAGSATDDGAAANLSYSWTQISGPAVTLNNASQAAASFDAPATASFVQLGFELSVSDGSLSDTDEVTVTVFNDTTVPQIVGKVLYEFVPGSGSGLRYNDIEERPVRGATVQLIEVAGGAVLATTQLDDEGQFLFPVTTNNEVFVRVRAELKRTGAPAWDVEVRDNTSATAQPLGQRPLYVLDGAPLSPSGPQGVTLTARTGWNGASYASTRAAAPFAILDTIYDAIQLVISVDPDAVMAPLDAFWSVNNTPTVNTDRNFDTGELGTSFYRGDLDSLFLLGDDNVDTEEFDTHVIAHEWGHYFEDNLARSDSVGGAHNLVQSLDPRLAFGEGFGNAISAMIVGDPVYFDSSGPGQTLGFQFSLETNSSSSSNRGWYNELSIQSFLYDVFDSNDDEGDTISLGFGPIYEVLVNEQASGVPFTTIYPFVEGLRNREPASLASIEAMLNAQRIRPDTDAYGSGETEDANYPGILPIYTELVPGGAPVSVCSTNRFDPDEDGNKLGIRRFLRFDIPTAGPYTIDVTTTNPPASGQSDPDVEIYQVEFIALGFSAVADRENFTANLQAGEHVMDVYEFSYLRDDPVGISQPGDETCFSITISP